MKKFLLGVLCTILLATVVECYASVTQMEVFKQQEQAWEIACAIGPYDCLRAPDPIVIYEDLSEEEINGRYSEGDSFISIDIELRGTPKAMVFMVHEYLHYLQWIHRDPKTYYTDEFTCAQEEESHRLAYEVAVILGIESDPEIFTWKEIHLTYECPL